MKKFFLSACLMLLVSVATANAQFYTSETTRKAGEKRSQGDHAGAIAILDRAIEQRKDLHEAYQMRASLRGSLGDLDGAITDYTEALKITPNNATLYERRAMLRSFRRDSAGALQDFDAAIANNLKTESAYTGRARIKQDMGDAEGAIADYQSALFLNPMLASAHNGLASAYERKGDLDAAIVHLQDFLDRYEGKRDGKLPRLPQQTPTGPGVSVRRDGREKDGSQVFLQSGETVVTFKANSPEEMEKQRAKYDQLMHLASAYANLGRMYAKRNDFDRALENYEKGLRIRKGDPYIHKLRSELRIKRGDLQGAIEDLTVATNSQTGAPDRHFNKGLLLVLQGRDDEAEKEFALHLQGFPEGRESLNKRIEAAKKLRSQQPQQ